MRGLDITSDSRKVRPGWTFYAVKGEGLDGHDFVGDAIKRGAKRIVAERPVGPLPEGEVLELVPDSRMGFYEEFWRKAGLGNWPGQSVGITGTNGKTSISFMIEFLLGRERTARLGTIDYSLGGNSIPAATTTPGLEDFLNLLLKVKEMGLEFLVMEVSSHSLVQRRLGGFRFDVAVFTNLSRDHLDYHRDEEDYFQAKRRLFFEHLKEEGLAVVNCFDDWGRRLYRELKMAGKRVIGIGEDVGIDVESVSLGGIKGQVSLERRMFELEVPLIGRYNFLNAVQSWVVACRILGTDGETLAKRLKDFPGVPGRMERIRVRGREVFIDYAHTPDGLDNALRTLRELKGQGKLICVFGCGGDRDRGKRPIMGKISDQLADVVVITSDNPRSEDPEKIVEDIVQGIPNFSRLKHIVEIDRYRAIRLALEITEEGDIVLIAGKGHEDYQIVGNKRYHFSDREVVLEWASSE